ncbi:MAG TPA: heme o synthase [Candidatus Limnocylindrales bacterium]|nr:heme o synthase [Candidatus Limnocylindrales bacterium]
MTRFQKLAASTLGTAILLVTVGVIVRATDSGLGCPDWPLCHGQLLPPLGDSKAWIEWVHRTLAAIFGFEILGLALVAWLDHRDRRSLLWPSFGAVGFVGFQAWLGRETVRLGNSGASVTAHLAAAMLLVALLVFVTVRAGFPARLGHRGDSQRFTLLAAFAALSTFALLLFGSHVTATDTALVFPDWPLMNGTLFPTLTELTSPHVLHRWVAVVVGAIVVGVAVVAARTQRDRPTLVRLSVAAAALFAIQVLVGGLQVLTQLSAWSQTLHLALGAVIFAMLVGLAVTSFYAAQVVATGADRGAGTDLGDVDRGNRRDPRAVPQTTGDRIRAYIALTKPRIIELLLVTTVPAMVLATRWVPGIDWGDWGWRVAWTLVGGTLAAGSANAINCYLDRDIDELMARTRRRPLPAHQVEPEHAVVFGIVLGVVSFGLMAWTINLLAAFLTLLAIAFYVVVYTMLLKRSTPQNIVIGGAAGALPPVIGWAAVTGNVGIPALILFALVFYWTPPHFWALSLRIRKDYAAAGVPMLPVVRGIPETTRQIALYTVLMVAISLVLWPVAQMGLIYLGAAVGLGTVFIWQAIALWRQGASEQASTQGAIRLYRYSISYLSLLFLAIAVDAIILTT